MENLLYSPTLKKTLVLLQAFGSVATSINILAKTLLLNLIVHEFLDGKSSQREKGRPAVMGSYDQTLMKALCR